MMSVPCSSIACITPSCSSEVSTSILDSILNFHCSGVCPHDSCILSIIRGFRQGVVYGCKIRFPHALVMTVLFRNGSMSEKAKDIFNATYTHAWNLGRFVAVYKAFVCIFRHFRGVESGFNSLAAGFIGGAIMFGQNNPINSQINMYILSRIIFGLIRTGLNHGIIAEIPYAYTLYAATIWALVMYLFHFQEGTLQSSLCSSMQYLYKGKHYMHFYMHFYKNHIYSLALLLFIWFHCLYFALPA